MNYDDERTNRTFSAFLIGIIIAGFLGFASGVVVTIAVMGK